MDLEENNEFKDEKLCEGLTNFQGLLTQVLSQTILL